MTKTAQVEGEFISVRPLLTTLAVARSGDNSIPGHYCPDQQVWVVETNSGPKPLVQVCAHSAELTTKTKAQQEQDDQAWPALMEGTTKTSVRQERDDASLRDLAILELATKTEVKVERDDR
ncbi:hypothetical protein [Muricoccus radiodurans]|uniref:hypothetical protein n=1 Tax=Muricoccus radiodurans TaxID=2231721 RepID=UPI003CF3296C